MRKTIIASLMMLLIAAIGSPLAAQTRRAATKAKTTQTATTQSFILTKEGIGPIKLGMAEKDIPSSVPGLYVKVTSYPWGLSDQWDTQYLLWSAQEPVLTVGVKNARVVDISTESSKIRTSIGAKVGESIAKFMRLQGSKKLSDEDNGTRYINGDFTILPTEDMSGRTEGTVRIITVSLK